MQGHITGDAFTVAVCNDMTHLQVCVETSNASSCQAYNAVKKQCKPVTGKQCCFAPSNIKSIALNVLPLAFRIQCINGLCYRQQASILPQKYMRIITVLYCD